MSNFLTIKQVSKMTHRSTTSINRDRRMGLFPSPVELGPRSVRWIESEVMEWMASRPRRDRKEVR